MGRPSKKAQMQGAQNVRNEAYKEAGRNKPAPEKAGKGYSAIPRSAGQVDFLRSRHRMLPKGILFDLDDTIIAYSPVAEPTWRRICMEYESRNSSINSDKLFQAIRQVNSWYWSDKERHKHGRRDLNRARRLIVSLAFKELNLNDRSTALEIADVFSEQREQGVHLFEKADKTLEYLCPKYFSGLDD